jgi:hypothetical protein
MLHVSPVTPAAIAVAIMSVECFGLRGVKICVWYSLGEG